MNNLNRSRILLLALIFSVTLQTSPSLALTTAPQVAQDKESGYDRSFFKHWIDEDKDKCDTRAEVLISEAVVKPKVDKKCKITGGKWLSAYDGKSITNASQLDVDHLVPLAEAWRSGAWAWTPKQRQDFANDLGDKRALIAVTLTTNRSKGDKDISDWVPKVDPCGYVQNWIAIKIRYSLTYDAKEAKSLASYFEVCRFGDIPVQALSGYSYQSQTVQPLPSTGTNSLPEPPNPIITYSDVKYLGLNLVLVKMSIINNVYKNVVPRPYDTGFSISSDSSLTSNPALSFVPIKCFRGELTEQNVYDNFAGGSYSPYPLNTELFIQTSKSEDLISCLLAPELTFKISFEVRAFVSDKGKKSDVFEIAASAPMPTPTPTASPAPVSIVSPGAFCSPAGATGKSANGTAYTCKTSATDTRNRWRQ